MVSTPAVDRCYVAKAETQRWRGRAADVVEAAAVAVALVAAVAASSAGASVAAGGGGGGGDETEAVGLALGVWATDDRHWETLAEPSFVATAAFAAAAVVAVTTDRELTAAEAVEEETGAPHSSPTWTSTCNWTGQLAVQAEADEAPCQDPAVAVPCASKGPAAAAAALGTACPAAEEMLFAVWKTSRTGLDQHQRVATQYYWPSYQQQLRQTGRQTVRPR